MTYNKDTSMESLERRLAILEQKMGLAYNDNDEAINEEKRNYPNELKQIEATLALKTNRKSPAMIELGQKWPQIQNCIRQSNVDSDTLSVDAKKTLVSHSVLLECEAKNIEKQVNLLEKVKDSEKILNSEHIKNVGQMEAKLAQLTSQQADQIQKASGIHSEILNTVQVYNSLMKDINKRFIHWDAQLKRAEKKNEE